MRCMPVIGAELSPMQGLAVDDKHATDGAGNLSMIATECTYERRMTS